MQNLVIQKWNEHSEDGPQSEPRNDRIVDIKPRRHKKKDLQQPSVDAGRMEYSVYLVRTLLYVRTNCSTNTSHHP
jgi:hypothetical protein